MTQEEGSHHALDVKGLMKDHYLKYASYVILDRAIPDVVDGLKPVQRRILHTLWLMDDGKLHKVANVAGQTMAFHPHGDRAIIDALVNLTNKGFLLDFQGNFGNILTGDPAAAGRYIETRLSKLAKETCFNPDLTETVPSYDGRNNEPVQLPAKIPLLLLQGAEGIAVGMATKILPHNFKEVLEAEIAYLQGEPFTLYPDFPTGGIMDASQYAAGKGKIKLRVQLEEKDPKTVVIKEICYGTTTESLIQSIDEAAKKGKIKIEAINDYTSDKVEIEISLPRGQYAEEVIQSLYAYTECEVSLTSQVVVIKDQFPWETDVHEILKLNADLLMGYLKKELEIELKRLQLKIFEKSLEALFIEEKIYKKMEEAKTLDDLYDKVHLGFKPFLKDLLREPTNQDLDTLFAIPIRRISRFDLKKNGEDIAKYREEFSKIEKELKNVRKYTIKYLEGLIKSYGAFFPRKTKIKAIEELDIRSIATKNMQVGFDMETGFIGTKVTSSHMLQCTNFDKILLMYEDGLFKVISIPDKYYAHQDKNKVVFAGIADKKTILNVVYKDPATNLAYAKRFIVSQFILDKNYRFYEENMDLLFISSSEKIKLDVKLVPKSGQKIANFIFSFDTVLVKGVAAKGIRMSPRPVKKVVLIA